jgi:subtilisin-like proprotein convertase family protein/sugar lactone lactonase YvrE
MKTRPLILILCGVAALLALLLAVSLRWPRAGKNSAPSAGNNPGALAVTTSPGAVGAANSSENLGKLSAAGTNRLALRLANTAKSVGELSRAPHAVLLENAFVDTEKKIDFSIPKNLSAAGDPGAWIVQARGKVDAAFRAALTVAGAKEISYIPNNALLVRAAAGAADSLRGSPLVQAVLPYEPYYKVQPSLLAKAVAGENLPIGQVLTLGLFADGAEQTEAAIEKMGGVILARDRSPFGQVVRVNPPADWTALARLPGVMRLEPAVRRKLANDLTRGAIGVAANTVTMTNYLNLSGSNVTVEVNDTGVDAGHPDLMTYGNVVPTRVTGFFPSSTNDVDGHGTHVAGIIAGNGFESTTVTNARGSIMPGTTNQFRGKAPAAKLVAFGFLGPNDTDFVFQGDSDLQEAPANTNALISNNSWVNGDVNEYDLSAASYDAAVRDALPEVTGPQPVLFVFAAGNDGNGDDTGLNGDADSILSPGTAKDVVTVGAMEQFRNITNEVVLLDGTTNTIWSGMTDSGSQVAGYSARGNVGIQTEGDFGRFKPDVVAPGTFVVSLRSTMWDTNAYYNVTNNHAQFFTGLVADTNVLAYGILTIPQNAIGVKIIITYPGGTKNLPIYVSASGVPATNSYDLVKNNSVSIPPDNGGMIGGIGSILNSQIEFAIGAGTNLQPVTYNLETEVITTNDLGNTLAVLQGLNDNLCQRPYYYRYETGTSMAAPAVSGTLALMQDFFTNTLKLTPSPALLKAMLINGARVTGSYKFAVTNAINYQGWGLPKLTNSIPAALTNLAIGANRPLFFVDQSPTNTLMTGDRRTYNVTVPTAGARAQWLRVTLTWTDPPGNPAAAIKLVNDLDLVVTNLGTGAVYYGNNFNSGTPPASLAAATNAPSDNINNVENIYLPPTLGTNYSITVVGKAVNVNAVTLDQTNVVQDFALVVASGDGNNTNGVTFTPASYSQNLAPPITGWQPTNTVIFNQYAGANAPWLSTNSVSIGTNLGFGPTATLFVGVTNQFHFFLVTNTFAVTNANFTNVAFITFLPNTAAIPREGGYVDTTQNPTRPEADIEMYVASTLTEPLVAKPTDMMNLLVLSNCVRNLNEDAASVGRGGTEFVTYSDSAANQIYYIAVKCEDQMAGQFGFVAIFTDTPFSNVDSNGVQTVYGKLVPAVIPDGNNAHSTASYSFGLALKEIKMRRVTVTNEITHQNFGDLVGGLTHNNKYALLNNHDGFGFGTFTNAYDDSGEGSTNVYRHTDAPGTLRNFAGQEGIGVWILNEVDDSQTQTGRVDNFTLRLYPHQDKKHPAITVTVEPGTWFYDFVDVPVGYTNLLVLATNLPPQSVPPIQLFLNNDVPPDFFTFLEETDLTNSTPGGWSGSLSYGPPLAPGRYWIGLFNPDTVPHDVSLDVILSYSPAAALTVDYASTGPLSLRDDAVVTDSILVSTNAAIQSFSVGLRVDHPRISDLVFHLISPSGARYLLMENRGNQTTNGCGATVVITNTINVNANGNWRPNTNIVDTGVTSGTFPITYNFFVQPDQMTVYYGSNVITPANLAFDTGMTNNVLPGPGTIARTINVTYPPTGVPATSTFLTIIMNQFATTNRSTAWTYNAGGVRTNYFYLTFTEDTNLTTTPIKFGPPPFVPVTNTVVVWTDSFEAYPTGTNNAPAPLGNWSLLNGQSLIATNPPADSFTNWLMLPNSGVLSNTLPTIIGDKYQLTYALGALPYQTFYVANLDAFTLNPGNVQSFDTNANGSVFVSGAPLQQPSAVAVDANGNIFVSDQVVNSVERYTPTGVHTTFASTGLNFPVALAFDSAGNLFVANFATGSGDGSVVRIAPSGVQTIIATNLSGPNGLAVDAGDNVYVAEATSDDVLKITPANVISTYATFAGGSFPWGMVFDSSTNLYVALNATPNVVKVNPSGVVSIFAAPFTAPFGLAFDNNTNLYVTDSSQTIFKVGPAGGVPALFSAVGATTYSPVGLAYFNSDPEGANSLGWLPQAKTFTAVQNGTPLVLATGNNAATPGTALPDVFNFNATFDTFALTQLASDLYYQPESSLDDLLNTSAAGEWQLEVMDNRAGGAATNGATLVSWRLEFVLASTNLAPASFGTLIGGVASQNTLVAGGGTGTV